VSQGLTTGRACVYVLADAHASEALRDLSRTHDVREATGSGALSLYGAADLRSWILSAAADGSSIPFLSWVPGTCVVVDAAGAVAGPELNEAYPGFLGSLSRWARDVSAIVVVQHDPDEDAPRAANEALQNLRAVVSDDGVAGNPFCAPAVDDGTAERQLLADRLHILAGLAAPCPTGALPELLDEAPDIIYRVDGRGRLTHLNAAFERATGRKREKLIGRPFTDLLAPEDARRGREFVSRQLKGEMVEEDLEFAVAGNATRGYSVLGHAVPGPGRATAAIGVARDVSPRKEMERQLLESETGYRAILDSAPVSVMLIDESGVVRDVNAWHVERIGGPRASRSDYVGQNLRTSPREAAAGLSSFYDRLCQGQPFDLSEVYLPETATGRPVWVNIRGAPLYGDDGHMRGAIVIHEDITELKQMQQHMLVFERVRALGEMSAGVAHEFNNLLAIILGQAELALMRPDRTEDVEARLRNIIKTATRGADTVRGLQAYARQRTKRPGAATDVNNVVVRAVETACELARRLGETRERPVQIVTDLGAPPAVAADPAEFGDAVGAVVENAVEAAAQGWGTVRVTTRSEDAHAVVEVSDDGPGIAATDMQRIFDPFFTTKEMGRGTGLGLAMVYGIVKGHGGIIEVDSELGEGTTFTIYLRASKKGVVEKQPETKEIMRGMETILLVDDEPIVREVNRDMLTSLGYRVYTAAGGQEALAVFAENAKDIRLVILDMIMPGLNGGETFDQLREISSEVVVLLSSGYSIDGEAKKILTRGCNGFLQKPFHLQTLSRKLRELLDGGETVKKPQAP